MDLVILIIIGSALLYLGGRLFFKIREMGGWSDDDSIAGKTPKSTSSSEQQRLQLESDNFGDISRLPSNPEDPPAKL